MNQKIVVVFIITFYICTLIGYFIPCRLISFSFELQASLVQDPVIAEMISKIDETEIYNTAYNLQSFMTRKYGTPGNVEAANYLYGELGEIPRLNVEYQGGDLKNIIATLDGTDIKSNVIYIVGAHYDSSSSNQSYAPGATDNGGGVAIVLEFARIMSHYEFKHTIKFALWNNEELGGVGSASYTKYAYENHLNISLYMNYDSACYDPNNNLILDIMFNNQSQWVSEIMTQCNSLYNIGFSLTYNIHNCVSDHRSFWHYGYTAIMTHQETHGPAHTQDDTIDKVSTTYAKKNGQLGMSVLAKLAEARVRGDINSDGIVDIFDVVILANAFGTKPGDAKWNPDADLNNDDVVDIFDVTTIAKNFGSTA